MGYKTLPPAPHRPRHTSQCAKYRYQNAAIGRQKSQAGVGNWPSTCGKLLDASTLDVAGGFGALTDDLEDVLTVARRGPMLRAGRHLLHELLD